MEKIVIKKANMTMLEILILLVLFAVSIYILLPIIEVISILKHYI